MKICIDFQGGAHGNFLEFVCNKIAGAITNDTPFNSLGASHQKQYFSQQIFYANHYSFGRGILDSNQIVSIQIDVDDLLPLSLISFLRAGDHGYVDDELEINTYHKFNNHNYRWVLDNIIDSFFKKQIETSYNQVKDPLWPDVKNIEDFKKLPEHIRKECIEIHNLELLELNETSPNCPRHILREFFQIGFSNPETHGFITQQQKIKYPDASDIHVFPFKSFYNAEMFISEVKKVASWANLSYNNWNSIVELHKLFLEKQPYKDAKTKCDQIVNEIINNGQVPKVSLLEEAYINAMLEKQGYECRY